MDEPIQENREIDGPSQPEDAVDPKKQTKDGEDVQDQSTQQEYKTTGYRWIIQLVFCGQILAVNIASIGFSTYLKQIRTAYGVSAWLSFAFVTLPTFLYPPFSFVGAYFFACWPIHYVLNMAMTMLLLGSWFRSLSFVGEEAKFWVLFVGQTLVFMAQPLMMNSISTIANIWFAKHERARSTAYSGLMSPIGAIVGLIITGVIAAGVDSESPTDCLDRLQQIVLVQNVVFTVLALAFLLLFREKPKKPPSEIAATFNQKSQRSIWRDGAILAKNRNYCLVCAAFVIIYGDYLVFATTISILFGDDFNPSQLGIIGVTANLASFIGGYLMGWFIDKTQRYVLGLLLVSIGLCSTFSFGLFLAPLGILWLTCILAAFVGFFMQAMMPVSFAFSVKTATETTPSVANGLMLTGLHIYAFAMNYVVAYFASMSTTAGLLCFGISAIVATICICCIKQEKKESMEDQEDTEAEASKENLIVKGICDSNSVDLDDNTNAHIVSED